MGKLIDITFASYSDTPKGQNPDSYSPIRIHKYILALLFAYSVFVISTTAVTAASPKEEYTRAFDLMLENKYAQAEVAFKTFIDSNKDHPLTGNALFWLGESYWYRDMYLEAAQTFVGLYQGDPGGSKAPDALLKLGMSMAKLGKPKAACASLAKILIDFPYAPTKILKKVSRENKKIGCAQPTSTPKAPVASQETENIESRLSKLKKLVDQGLITKKEAAAKRKKILDDL